MKNIIFTDIETIPNADALETDTWKRKVEKLKKANENVDLDLVASLSPIFGKIICICAKVFVDGEWRLFSEAGDDEKEIIQKYYEFLEASRKVTGVRCLSVCAHNAPFDFPFIAKRGVFHELQVPIELQMHGKKPWELDHIKDTAVIFKFNDFKGYHSLDELCLLLGVKTPKDGIDGSMVFDAWKQGKILAIEDYCQQDVRALAEIYWKSIEFKVNT